MQSIKVRSQKHTEGGWTFSVEVDGESYQVRVDDDYLLELTDGRDRAEDLVKWSFEFLLAREPKESILSAFNLRQIMIYFPDYEKQIKSQFQ